MTTYLPCGPLVSFAPTGGTLITFDAGRTSGPLAGTRAARPPYGAIMGTTEPYDLNQTTLVPFDREEIGWQTIIACGDGALTTQHVQDQIDLITAAFYAHPLGTLTAYRLGYGVTVSNANARFVEYDITENIVVRAVVNLYFNITGAWT